MYKKKEGIKNPKKQEEKEEEKEQVSYPASSHPAPYTPQHSESCTAKYPYHSLQT
jgi:hypothetical protein